MWLFPCDGPPGFHLKASAEVISSPSAHSPSAVWRFVQSWARSGGET